MKIQIKGTIVPNDFADMYEWFGFEYTAPKTVADALNSVEADEDIDVDINSGGGEIYAGSEIYTLLKNHNGKVTVNIYGLSASSASIVAMAGDVVRMSPTSQMMIHNVSTSADGDYRDMDKTSDTLKKANDALANAYVLKTGINKDELLSMMNEETWLNSDVAVEKGFADEIMFVNENEPILSNGINSVMSKEALNKFMNMKLRNEDSESESQSESQSNEKSESTTELESSSDKSSESESEHNMNSESANESEFSKADFLMSELKDELTRENQTLRGKEVDG